MYHSGKLKDKNKVRSYFTLVWPSIEIHTVDGDELAIQVTKNKKRVKRFKKLFSKMIERSPLASFYLAKSLHPIEISLKGKYNIHTTSLIFK